MFNVLVLKVVCGTVQVIMLVFITVDIVKMPVSNAVSVLLFIGYVLTY